MAQAQPLIVYVDDEHHNLHSFYATFRHKFKIAVFDNVADAIAFIKVNEVAVVLADQRLPMSSGVDLLEWLATYNADISRVLVTGFHDKEPLVDAVNKGKIFHYVLKPWEDAQMDILLQHAVNQFAALTEIKQKNQKLEKLVDELERFIYSTSHDMRAPLTSMQGIINLMRLENGNGEYLDMMDASLNRLDTFLVNTIDHYKNLKLATKVGQIKLHKLLDDVVELIETHDRRQHINLHIDIDEQAELFTDEFRLRVVLSNILSNSFKFYRNEEENKWVTFKASIDKNNCTMIIEDNGQGIPMAKQKNVFDMFYRLNNNRSGSGLGLYIVKETVARLQGSIKLESEPGQFTRFTITIPNQAAAMANAVAETLD